MTKIVKPKKRWFNNFDQIDKDCILQDEYLVDIKKELAARLKPLDGCDEKELVYKTGWNDALMALIENRPIETNGNKGG